LEQLSVLVTGGAGFIGSHLTDALIERGHRVRVLDLLVPQVHGNGAPQYLNPQAEFVHGDVCDAAIVQRALDGVDVVFHEAAEVGVGQSMYEIDRYVRANDLGTGVLLQALIGFKDKIKKLVVASSMSIYGEARTNASRAAWFIRNFVRPRNYANASGKLNAPTATGRCSRRAPRKQSRSSPPRFTQLPNRTRSNFAW